MPFLRLISISFIFLLGISTQLLYADEKTKAPENPVEAKNKEETDKKINETDTSEVERILKLEATLKNDKKSLQEIKVNLTSRTKISKILQSALKEGADHLEKREAILIKAKEKGNTEQIANLEKEINSLKSDYTLLKDQAQLAFEAEKTVKSQIELLETSIYQQQLVLDELKGIKKPGPLKTEQSSVTAPVKPAPVKPVDTKKALPKSPIQQIIQPAAPLPVETKDSTETTQQPVEQLQTAEQIEARKQAEKRADEAFRAEQVALDYIEQKSVYLEQIKLAEELLKTDIASRDNYQKIITVMEKKLEGLKKSSASKKERDKIANNLNLVQSELKKVEKQIEKKTANLKLAEKHLQQLEKDQEILALEAQKKREEAEAAQKQVIWLQSPLHPRNLLSWVYTRGPRVLLVLIIMALLLLINKVTANRISRVMARKSVRKGEMSQNRVNTLALSYRGAARVVIIFGGTLVALQEAGVDIKTVLGGAAILGVAVAFGAQNLMRDYFNGFMILLEDQYELNDFVTINNISGTVERVSMRTTMLRDLNGRAHFIPNGAINHVTNSTYEWSRAVFDILVAYKESVDHVMTVIIDLANELTKDEEFGSTILGEPIMLGVNSFEESGVTIKFMLQTKADKNWPVRREMLRRIKNKFDEVGIEIPVPHRVITQQTK